jgi:hypothetical protein
MVFKNKELGLEIAESPREKLILETIENVEKSITALQLEMDLKVDALRFLKTLK